LAPSFEKTQPTAYNENVNTDVIFGEDFFKTFETQFKKEQEDINKKFSQEGEWAGL
jgi:hypothetical protein